METIELIKAVKKTIFLGDFPYRKPNGIMVWPVEMQNILNKGCHIVIREYLSELDELTISEKQLKKEVEDLNQLLEIITKQHNEQIDNQSNEIPKYEQELAIAKEELKDFEEKCNFLDITINKETITEKKEKPATINTKRKKSNHLFIFLEIAILIFGEILLWLTLGDQLLEFKSTNQIIARALIYLVIYALFEIVKKNRNNRFHPKSKNFYIVLNILCLIYILVSPIIAIQLGVFNTPSANVTTLFETNPVVIEENTKLSQILFSEFIPLFISTIGFIIISSIPNKKKREDLKKASKTIGTSSKADGTNEYQKCLEKIKTLEEVISTIKLKLKNLEENSPKDLIIAQREVGEVADRLEKIKWDRKELLQAFQNRKKLLLTELDEFRITFEHELSNSPQKYGLTAPISWPVPKDIIYYYKN